MTEKYRVHEIVKFNYSDIGEYVDEYHTDTPLMNYKVANLLNRLTKENEQLKQEVNKLEDENKNLKEDLEHCANQFTDDGRNVLLSLR